MYSTLNLTGQMAIELHSDQLATCIEDLEANERGSSGTLAWLKTTTLSYKVTRIGIQMSH